MKHRASVLLFATLIAGCSRIETYEQPTPVTMENQSAQRLTNVKLRTDGFIEPVGDLEPNATAHARVMARGESGVAVSFTAGDGREVKTRESGYFEGNGLYDIRVIVRPDLTVDVHATVRTPGSTSP